MSMYGCPHFASLTGIDIFPGLLHFLSFRLFPLHKCDFVPSETTYASTAGGIVILQCNPIHTDAIDSRVGKAWLSVGVELCVLLVGCM